MSIGAPPPRIGKFAGGSAAPVAAKRAAAGRKPKPKVKPAQSAGKARPLPGLINRPV